MSEEKPNPLTPTHTPRPASVIYASIGNSSDILVDEDEQGREIVQVVQGNVFEFGPAHSEAMVIWMKSGFSGLYTDWFANFVPRWCERPLSIHTPQGWKTFHLNDRLGRSLFEQREPTLLHITEPLEKLAYLYVHPNPGNTWSKAKDVASMTRRALDTLAHLRVTSVTFNGIQGTKAEGGHSKQEDLVHAQLMVNTIRRWVKENSGCLRTVYLVDQQDGFRSVAS